MTYSKADSRLIVKSFWNASSNVSKSNGVELVYESQATHAMKICNSFWSGKSIVCFISGPQWGKTGVAIKCIYEMTTHPDDDIMIHPDNVYVISGLSDLDWKAQTKHRMLPCFKDRVYHRNDVHKFVSEIVNKRDVLIVIDEVHVAIESNQTMCTCLKDSGIWDIDFMKSHNVKILCISATPGHVVLDMKGWGNNQETIVAKSVIGKEGEGEAYTGFGHLLQENRVMSFGSELKDDAILRMFELIESRWPSQFNVSNARYHIIRLSDRNSSNLINMIEEHGYELTFHNSAKRIIDVDTLLNTQPLNHHFILIKGFWRQSTTLNDKYIGICYENSADYSCISQGLGGRLLGYKRQRGTQAPILLSNKVAIEEYVSWLNNDGDYLQCKTYNSAVLKIADGRVKKKKKSSMHPNEVANMTRTSPGFTKKKEVKEVKTVKTVEAVKEEKTVKTKRASITPLIRVNRVGIVAKIQPGVKIATIYEEMLVSHFMERFGVTTIPGTARELRAILLDKQLQVNVSYATITAASDTNLKTFYLHSVKWAATKYHIIKLNKDDDKIIVITRDLDILNNAKPDDMIAAHNHKNQIVLYMVAAD
jgi:hypothetical protein